MYVFEYVYAVPDLPLCLGVLKHRAPLARWPIFLQQNKKRWILLMWCNFKYEGVLFLSDSRQNDI